MLLNYRTPFELNTLNCAAIAFFQTFGVANASAIFYTTVCMFTEIVLYNRAINIDIKSLFDRMDYLAKSKSTELSMLECCKEAVKLHGKVYR